ncbi:TPA: ABC transporter ATP-binding protein, partial [Aeromonas hydrophila]
MFHLEVNQLHKSYGDTKVFEGIEFGIRKGELVTLLGPSG